MSGLTYKPVKIEITYSNSETRKLGIKEGDIFDAEQEYFNDKPKYSFFFSKNGENCVAYDVKHDEEAMLMVTTCKIHIENKVDKQLESDLNRVKAQLKQLNESELFSKEDRERLNPIYEAQIRDLSNKMFTAGAEIKVIDAEILTNNQPGE